MKNRETTIRNQQLLHLCIIAVSVIAAYARVTWASFLSWDDGEYVLQNSDIKAINAANIKSWFSNFYVGNYQPLTMASYALDYVFGGLRPFVYHLTSVLLHLANACLVYVFIGKLQHQKTIALGVALLFALHPMQAESVAWVAERKTVLCGFFSLLAMLQYQGYVREPRPGRMLLLLLLSACAMLGKGTAVTLPLCLLAIDLWLERDMRSREVWLEKLPLIALSGIMGAVAIVAQQSGKFMNAGSGHGLAESVVYGGYAYIQYIVRFVVPAGLSAMYPYPDGMNALHLIFFAAALGMIALFVVSVKKRWNVLSGGILFYTANIILLLQFIPFGEALMADRYMYLSCIGLAYPAVYYTAGLVRSYRLNRQSTYAGALIAMALLVSCYSRNGAWMSDMSFFSALAERFPDSGVAQYSLGAMYMKQGDDANAALHLDKAVRLEPGNAKAWYNKGLLHTRRNEAMYALEAFDKAIAINDYPKARLSRAMLHLSSGKPDLGLADVETVLRAQPSNARAICLKGYGMELMGKLPEAIDHYNKAIETDASQPFFYTRRGMALCKLQQYGNAITDLNTSIEMAPENGEAYYWRAIAKLRSGQPPCPDLRDAVARHYPPARQAIGELCK